MAKVHGKKAKVYLTDVGGTERDLSNFFNSFEVNQPVDMAETSGFGDNDKTYVVGLKSATLRGAGLWSGTANEVDDVLMGLLGGGASGTVNTVFKWAPQGSASGFPYLTGTALVTNYSPNSAIGGAVTFSFDGQVSGSITRSTF